MIAPKAALFSAGFIVLMIVAGFVALGHVPADGRIATHFALDGTPNGWMSPVPAFFLGPLIGALLWLLALIIPRLGEGGARLARFPRVYAILWLLPVLIAVPADFQILTPALGLSRSSFRLMPAMTGILFILLGNVMGKLPPNPYIGIRTPWTRADERVWDQTHRFGGPVFVIGGFIILASAVLAPQERGIPVVLIVTIAAAALCTVKSWLLSRAQRRR